MKSLTMTRLRAALAILLAACGIGGRATAAEPLVMAVVPQFPALDIHRAWNPVATALTGLFGRPVVLRLYPSIPAFESDFLSGVPDIVYLNPYHMVMARKAQGYVPAVRDDSERLSGILVVNADSPVKDLRGLEGMKIAFPSPNAFGASLLIRALLANQHGIRFQASYAQTHSNAYRLVARGEVEAAGGIRATLAREPEELRSRLRVLYESPGFPSHPLALHPRLKFDPQAVARTFQRLKASPEGQQRLKAIHMTEPVPAEYARDYGNLDKLGLENQVASGSKP